MSKPVGWLVLLAIAWSGGGGAHAAEPVEFVTLGIERGAIHRGLLDCLGELQQAAPGLQVEVLSLAKWGNSEMELVADLADARTPQRQLAAISGNALARVWRV